VVAAGDDDGAFRAAIDLGDEIVVLRDRALRRMGGIEDIPGDEEDINAQFLDATEEELEESLVFLIAGEVSERFAEVPVSGVEDPVRAGPARRDLGREFDNANIPIKRGLAISNAFDFQQR